MKINMFLLWKTYPGTPRRAKHYVFPANGTQADGCEEARLQEGSLAQKNARSSVARCVEGARYIHPIMMVPGWILPCG